MAPPPPSIISGAINRDTCSVPITLVRMIWSIRSSDVSRKGVDVGSAALLINRLRRPGRARTTSTTSRRSGSRSSMAGAVAAMVDRGHTFKTVIDVGASNGIWSEMVMKHYPDASYLLIEALPAHHAGHGQRPGI